MRIRGFALLLISLLVLAACQVEISTTGDEEPAAAQEQSTEPTPEPATAEPSPTPVEEATALEWDEVLELLAPSIVKVQAAYADTDRSEGFRLDGTGIVLTEDGHILTAAAVAAGADEVRVLTDWDARPREAELLGNASCDNLSIIQVQDTSGMTPATLLETSELQPGTAVATIGYPFGESDDSPPAMEVSRVIAPSEPGFPLSGLIEHDGFVLDGVDGGPLVDQFGRVVGMNTYFSREDGPEGYGLAISMEYAIPLTEVMMDGESPRFLGITMVPNDYPEFYMVEHGALVSHVAAGSPAEAVGLQAGYLITMLNGQEVPDIDAMCQLTAGYGSGDEVPIGVMALEDYELRYMEGSYVYGDPSAATPLEIIWTMPHEGFIDQDEREHELETSDLADLIEWAQATLEPPQWELMGPMTMGIGYGIAEIHYDHWAHCDNEWVILESTVISLEADIWIDEPRIGEPNPVYLTLQSYEHDVEGSFVLISAYEDDFTAEFIQYWDIQTDGIFIAGELVDTTFDPIDAGGFIWSYHLDDGCQAGSSSGMMRSPAMGEGSVFAGYIGPETAELYISGTTWDGFRDFVIYIEAEMFGWDELNWD
jgi:S1-C subfamily serine protease